MSRPPESRDRITTLASFVVGGDLYAIEASQVREIVRWQRPMPLPQAPPLIEGVIDLRGAVVPVVDLGRVLGRGPVAERPAARIAIVVCAGLVVGLAVDAAEAVISLDVALLEEPPALATRSGYAMLQAVVRRSAAPPVLVLDLAQVVASVHRSALAKQEDAA